MKNKAYDRHHFFPVSLFPELKRTDWNIRWIKRTRHQAWHFLCGNRTPLQAIVFLFHEFVPKEGLQLDPAYEEFRNLLGEVRYEFRRRGTPSIEGDREGHKA